MTAVTPLWTLSESKTVPSDSNAIAIWNPVMASMSLYVPVEISIFVDLIYQILLVANLEIDFFAIAGQIEYVFVLGLGVHEVSGFLLADTGAIGSYEVMAYVIGYRQKLGASDIYDFLANHKMHSKGIPLNSVLRRN
jgi:hypothetical protein